MPKSKPAEEIAKKRRLDAIVGANLRAERQARHMTMEDMAEALNLSVHMVRLMEKGDRGVTPTNMQKLSEMFDMPLDAFYIPRTESKYSLREEAEDPRKYLRQRIKALTLDFSAKELEFLISTIRNFRLVHRSNEYVEEEAGNEGAL